MIFKIFSTNIYIYFFNNDKDEIWGLSIFNNGRFLVTGSWDKSVKLFEIIS